MAYPNTSWSGQRRSFPTATRRLIMERDKWQCQIKGPNCLGKGTQADHILNHAEGGDDTVTNGQAVCNTCHKAKTHAERLAGMKKRSKYRPAMQHPGLAS